MCAAPSPTQVHDELMEPLVITVYTYYCLLKATTLRDCSHIDLYEAKHKEMREKHGSALVT